MTCAPHPVIVSNKKFQTTEDEVFDFSNTEFTREDLINALNEMVHEYRKPSQTFKEIKAENGCLKNSSIESSTAQLEDTDILQTELTPGQSILFPWVKLHEAQKPLNDKSGLGFSVGESSSGETSTQLNLAYDKFKKMNFVKASVIHDACESVKYDDQISPKLNHKGKQGIGYTKPEKCKSSWLKKRLEKDKAKAGSKFSVPKQQRHGSTKAKSVWVKVQPKRNLNYQNFTFRSILEVFVVLSFRGEICFGGEIWWQQRRNLLAASSCRECKTPSFRCCVVWESNSNADVAGSNNNADMAGSNNNDDVDFDVGQTSTPVNVPVAIAVLRTVEESVELFYPVAGLDDQLSTDMDARASGDSALSSPCWDLLAPMRRVASCHSYPAGHGADLARGAPGGG
ncbi:hypothetical protein F511_16620 [Dorcoceras hygrometricum]|uniref:Uncharacterized protein n=1 Tax=Dorcoceras hygrometricum TaxID=472368 RepID=A0A2Z7BXZ0_9LAMI|nr:hypothetical protein F511_16620 [Dorcoceras hygrometricum]